MFEARLVPNLAASPVRMQRSFVVSFKTAAKDDPMTMTYLNDILLPIARDADDRAGLFASDEERLVASGTVIGLGSIDGAAVAGMYMTVDADGVVWFRGVCVQHPFRGLGLGSQLVGEACDFAREELRRRKAALTVRCGADGRPRETALRTYGRCGFRFVRVLEVVIAGSPYDQHLGPAGSTFRTALMERSL